MSKDLKKISNQKRGPMGGHGPGPRMVLPGEKAKDFKGTLKRLLGYLKPRRFTLIFVFIMAILSTLFNILSPKVMGEATTTLFNGVTMKLQGIPGAKIDFYALKNILILLTSLYLFSAFFGYLQQYFMAGVAQKTVQKMRKDVNEKLARLPLKYFDSNSHGDILSRVTNDIDNISSTLQQSLTQLITAIVTMVGILIMMLSISPIMTLICLITLPACIFATRPIIKRSQKFFLKQQKELGKLNGHIEEMYTGHQIIKAFGHEEKAIDTFNEINDKLYQAGWKAQFVSGLMMPLMNFINNIGYVLVSVVGGLLVTKKYITIGDIQAFIQYSKQFTQPINQTANIANIIQSTIESAERVFEILDETEEIQDTNTSKVDEHTINNLQGSVKFDHVKFGYKEDSILIEDMNIDVKPGETIAIVGPTGAGKTTLVNLLMRFYEINDGKITIDGINIIDFNRGDLRTTFGMVLQDTWLFKGTIKENIAYGKENSTDEDVIKAAKAAHADHFIRTLPKGYDTLLNEDASNISQGQKQLLTIARAILANPRILILDEATSSVDTRTESYIQNAMTRLMEGRTNFVIAHRLSTIKDADLILVMNHGDVIEKGTHSELLAQKGFYSDLYNSQFNHDEEAV